MSEQSEAKPEHSPELSTRFPTAYSILFLLIVFVAALTWIVPAGKYDRAINEEVGREIAVAGTYAEVDPKLHHSTFPQGRWGRN